MKRGLPAKAAPVYVYRFCLPTQEAAILLE